MSLSVAMSESNERRGLRASPPGVSLGKISPIFRSEGLDSMCVILHTMSMADIRQSILDRMKELDWTINHVSVLVNGRIPRRTVYAYLTGESDARTEVASVLMEVLGLTITVQPVKRASRPRKGSEK
jgi:hypothetical protein